MSNGGIILDSPKLRPQTGSQLAFYECPFETILLHGTRGGGKTLAIMQKFHRHLLLNERKYGTSANCWGAVIRETYPQLKEAIGMALECFPARNGCQFNKAEKVLTFPNGAKLEFAHIERQEDNENYQGRNFSFIAIDEAANYKTSGLVLEIMATLRRPNTCDHHFVMTCNPNGVGKFWLRKMFIEKADACVPFYFGDEDDADQTPNAVHISSSFVENKALLKDRPNYGKRIAQSTQDDEAKRKAWLEGDWYADPDGAFSPCWDRNVHILPAWNEREWRVPHGYRVICSYDSSGGAKPFSYNWYFVTNGESMEFRGQQFHFPPKTLIMFYEYYGCHPNKENCGLHLSEDKICENIVHLEQANLPSYRHKINERICDTNLWSMTNGGYLVDSHKRKGFRPIKANKKHGSRITGWTILRSRLINAKENNPDRPHFYVTQNCKNLTRTLPAMVQDKNNPDDIDTNGEDHCCDSVRYAMLHLEQRGGIFTFSGT